MKINIFNIVAPVLFILILIIIYFFWGCKLDLSLTIFAGTVIALFTLVGFVQDKKIKALKDKMESK